MTTTDIFADFMEEHKDKRSLSGPSPIPNSGGSPQPGRKKVHHYESIWDFPASVPETDYFKRENGDHLMSNRCQDTINICQGRINRCQGTIITYLDTTKCQDKIFKCQGWNIKCQGMIIKHQDKIIIILGRT